VGRKLPRRLAGGRRMKTRRGRMRIERSVTAEGDCGESETAKRRAAGRRLPQVRSEAATWRGELRGGGTQGEQSGGAADVEAQATDSVSGAPSLGLCPTDCAQRSVPSRSVPAERCQRNGRREWGGSGGRRERRNVTRGGDRPGGRETGGRWRGMGTHLARSRVSYGWSFRTSVTAGQLRKS